LATASVVGKDGRRHQSARAKPVTVSAGTAIVATKESERADGRDIRIDRPNATWS